MSEDTRSCDVLVQGKHSTSQAAADSSMYRTSIHTTSYLLVYSAHLKLLLIVCTEHLYTQRDRPVGTFSPRVAEAVKTRRKSHRPFELAQANRAHRVDLPLLTPLDPSNALTTLGRRAEIIRPETPTLPESLHIPSRRRGLAYRCGERGGCIETPSLGSSGSGIRKGSSRRRSMQLVEAEKHRVCDALEPAGDEGVSLLTLLRWRCRPVRPVLRKRHGRCGLARRGLSRSSFVYLAAFFVCHGVPDYSRRNEEIARGYPLIKTCDTVNLVMQTTYCRQPVYVVVISFRL